MMDDEDIIAILESVGNYLDELFAEQGGEYLVIIRQPGRDWFLSTYDESQAMKQMQSIIDYRKQYIH